MTNYDKELDELFELGVEAYDNLRGAESASDVNFGKEQVAEAKAKLTALLRRVEVGTYKRGYNTGYIKASRNDEQRKLATIADRLFNMAQELYTAAHENETKLPAKELEAEL